MPLVRLFCLLCLLIAGQVQAASRSENNSPECDTLITTDGITYLVRIGWQSGQEIQYTRCDEESGRVYALQRDKIRELKRGKPTAVADKQSGPTVPLKAPGKYQLSTDTFDLLTLVNGKTYRVVILVRDYLNTYYRLYDSPLDDREYCVPNQQIRSVRLSRLHQSKAKRKKGAGCLILLLIPLALLFLLLLAASA